MLFFSHDRLINFANVEYITLNAINYLDNSNAPKITYLFYNFTSMFTYIQTKSRDINFVGSKHYIFYAQRKQVVNMVVN